MAAENSGSSVWEILWPFCKWKLLGFGGPFPPAGYPAPSFETFKRSKTTDSF